MCAATSDNTDTRYIVSQLRRYNVIGMRELTCGLEKSRGKQEHGRCCYEREK